MAKNNRTIDRIQAVWNKLGGEEGVDRLLRGETTISVAEHVIDCDAEPFIPDRWRVEDHRKCGSLKFDSTQIEFYLDKNQKGAKPILGTKLRQRLKDKTCLNANVLDYLLAHQNLIPEEWKTDETGQSRSLYFWGTIYSGTHSQFVRGLGWDGNKWNSTFSWLDLPWDKHHYIAVLRSN